MLAPGSSCSVDEHLGNVMAHGVVASEGVAVPHDENAVGVHRASSSTTAPSASISWIRKAICPRACVEQLRHGS